MGPIKFQNANVPLNISAYWGVVCHKGYLCDSGTLAEPNKAIKTREFKIIAIFQSF